MNPPDKEPVFNEPWEAQVFALTVKLNEAGIFAWSEWTESISAEIREHPDLPYYQCWLAALERLVETKGLMSEAERLARVAAWDRAARATPHGQPIGLSRW